jgi:hypothetical protein
MSSEETSYDKFTNLIIVLITIAIIVAMTLMFISVVSHEPEEYLTEFPTQYENSSLLVSSNYTAVHTSVLVIYGSNNTEMFRISNNGSVYSKGVLVGNDSEIPELFKQAIKGVLKQ